MNDSLSVVISRRLPATRERVFAAWVEPEQLAQWYGPTVFSNEDVTVDLRVGGRFELVMVSPDGNRYPTGGEFLEVDPPSRLVYRDTSPELSDDFGEMVRAQLSAIGADPDTPITPIVTVTFTALGDETEVEIRSDFESGAARDALVRMQMVEGWQESLGSLERLLA